MKNFKSSWNIFRMQILAGTNYRHLRKMLQPIKSLFWEKWVWIFETLHRAIYVKHHYFFVKNLNPWMVRGQRGYRLPAYSSISQETETTHILVTKTVPSVFTSRVAWVISISSSVSSTFYNWKITLNYWFICKMSV